MKQKIPSDELIENKSHPSWVCGLKRGNTEAVCPDNLVTPFVGVWIETSETECEEHHTRVTPFVGVWIETRNRQLKAHKL